MKLIDADALIARLKKDPLFRLVEQYGITGVIEAEPTIDAVPVVRCKECRFYKENERWCRRLGLVGAFDKDGFCSRGERKAAESE